MKTEIMKLIVLGERLAEIVEVTEPNNEVLAEHEEIMENLIKLNDNGFKKQFREEYQKQESKMVNSLRRGNESKRI